MKSVFWPLMIFVAGCIACGIDSSEPNPPLRDLPWEFAKSSPGEPGPSEPPICTSSPEESQSSSSDESHSGDSEGEEEQGEAPEESGGTNHCGIEVECHCCTEDENCYGHGAVECSALVISDKGPGYVWFDGTESTTNFCTTGTFRRYDEIQGRGVFHYSACHPLSGDCLCAVESVVDCEAVVEWDCSE